MKKISKKALITAIVAGVLVLCDGIITKIFNQTASFTWIAFISWTVFWRATTKERLKAVLGYLIGFIAAAIIIKLGSALAGINTLYIAFGSILASFIINFLVMELENIEKYFPISFSGIFVGMSITFSGLGIGATINTIESSLFILAIIVIYGVLGLISGWTTSKFGQ